MDHYQDHVNEFGVTALGPSEYANMADTFLGAQLPTGVLEYIRSKGDIIRFNPVTNEFGILSSSNFIRTYFKPDPAAHGLPSNMDYFNRECGKH
jgi:filamentous hemagglutinin